MKPQATVSRFARNLASKVQLTMHSAHPLSAFEEPVPHGTQTFRRGQTRLSSDSKMNGAVSCAANSQSRTTQKSRKPTSKNITSSFSVTLVATDGFPRPLESSPLSGQPITSEWPTGSSPQRTTSPCSSTPTLSLQTDTSWSTADTRSMKPSSLRSIISSSQGSATAQ